MKAFIKKLLGNHLVKVSKNRWDEEYEKGSWSFLYSLDELGHYSIIHGLIQYFDKYENILDVGCGEGVLYEKINASKCKKYFGIDISEAAIQKATDKGHPHANYIACSVDEFITHEKFDAIVFNEVLYYLDNPLEVIKRYEKLLLPNGIIIISMHVNNGSNIVWNKLSKEISFLEETTISNKKGTQWVCKSYQLMQ